jgi:hypothetical protein
MSVLTAPAVARPERAGITKGYRIILLTAFTIAGIALLCHFGIMLWAQHEFSTPESVVATQSMMLAHNGTLYYGLHDYPYTVNAYMPLFYLLEAALIKAGLWAYTGARLISFAAMLGIFVLVRQLLLLYTRSQSCAWTGVILCASTSLILSWGTVGQVDTLAIFFAMLGFYQYSRYALEGEPTLLLAGVCVILACFTKQTAIACPAAIVALLWFRNRRAALLFAGGVGGFALLAVLAINTFTNGRFLASTLYANLNPFAWAKLWTHVHYILIGAGQLAIIAALGLGALRRHPGKALFLYLAFAMCVLGVTAPKEGSDSNYQIESTILLVLCACVSLDALDFFPSLMRNSKSWVTLLQLPLAIHLVLNYRIVEPFLVTRFARERQFRQQVAAERPYLADGGRVLSADINGVAHLRGYLEVEPLIYTWLVRAGRIDPQPVLRDIAAQTFSTIVLYRDVNRPFPPDLELVAFTDAQLDEIRKHYQLVAHIPGPYLSGVFIYKPNTPSKPRL